jgi:hypothetical protein
MTICRLPGCTNEVDGRADKQFCSLAHKQKYWRDQHKQDQAQGATFTAMLAELVDLRAKVADQAQRIEEQDQQITRLLRKLDIKMRLREDHERRGFIAWLKKQPAAHIGELGQRIRDDERMPSMGSRAIYAAHIRARYSKDDIDELNNLWELMLLQS